MPVAVRTTVGTSAVAAGAAAVGGPTTITALATNTDIIYVGYSSAVTTSTGTPLYPGETRTFSGDPSAIWLISGTASQAVGVVS